MRAALGRRQFAARTGATTVPDRAEAELAVTTIARLFNAA
jgi:hypothetical protein